jgi:hypothetical protein
MKIIIDIAQDRVDKSINTQQRDKNVPETVIKHKRASKTKHQLLHDGTTVDAGNGFHKSGLSLVREE